MTDLLTALAAKGRGWVETNRERIVQTPGVNPRRMAIAIEAVLAGPSAPDDRLTVMLGEMHAMGLPIDQQDAVARFCGAFGLRAPTVMSRPPQTARRRACVLGQAGVPRDVDRMLKDKLTKADRARGRSRSSNTARSTTPTASTSPRSASARTTTP